MIKKFNKYNEDINSKENIENYMFFENLKTIKRHIDELLLLDKSEVDKILTDGHDWANDHVSTSKDDIEEVYSFFINKKD